jgi:cytidylate kinase
VLTEPFLAGISGRRRSQRAAAHRYRLPAATASTARRLSSSRASWSPRADQDRHDRLDAAQSGRAADAIEIDSTGLSQDEVVSIIVRLAPERAEMPGRDRNKAAMLNTAYQ